MTYESPQLSEPTAVYQQPLLLDLEDVSAETVACATSGSCNVPKEDG